MNPHKQPGPKPTGRTERLTVYLSPEEKDALVVRATTERVPMAELVRRGIRQVIGPR